jgi:hypothetical protein
MVRALRTLAIAAVALVVCVAPAAGASGRDVAATHTFVKANYALGRTAKSRVALAEGSIATYISQISTQCHAAAFGSPGNSRAEQLSNEVVVVLNVLVYHANADAIAKLAHTVGGLHWSNHKVTHTIDSYVARLQAFATMPVPDLCGDVKAWAATDFKTVPADTNQVNQRYEQLEALPHHISQKLLAPYLKSNDARTFKLAQRLEAQLLELENNKGAIYWAEVLEALSMNP